MTDAKLDLHLCPICQRQVPAAPLSSLIAGGGRAAQRGDANLRLKVFAAHADDGGEPCSCRPSGDDALDDEARSMIFSDPRWWEEDLRWEAESPPERRAPAPQPEGSRILPDKLPVVRLTPINPPPVQLDAHAPAIPAPKKRRGKKMKSAPDADDVDDWQP